ncbi:oligosaccharide flippase family protein [Ideonella azotifigens]|uniref:Oligosaccharide flippase family protein n=1 Tax=Ideonella azotifigens TaxID=513160 RepID=A0ABN1K0N4_9BURK|nr:oligosaccharide flippase family protein [Ideonella azotifigens]MCD2341565.1 oligosaccharide flippase family protein [Ideonella azotifigens]
MRDTATPPLQGLLRASLTLLAGGALAQALPLLLGPLLTRLFTPAQFGQYHLFAAVATNLGVVACARYEFALPLARSDDEAQALRVLSLRILLGVALASALGALGWAALGGGAWVAWLPLAVAAAGVVSLATLWATREQRFSALAAARVLQYGGAALAQVAAGWAGAGVAGLIAAPIAATLLATVWLRLPLSGSAPGLGAVARQHRVFPLLNTPHAFTGALQDTLGVALIAASLGPAAAGFWGLGLRYLKAPATLVGSAVSQALYPKLAQAGTRPTRAARAALRRVMLVLAALALPLVALLWALAPWGFAWLFGAEWREAGELARALAVYIGLHFVSAPLAVVTMAWQAQAWALKLALVGQVAFVAALAAGLHWGGLTGAGWAVSGAMLLYFGYYLLQLAFWPVDDDTATEPVVEESRP